MAQTKEGAIKCAAKKIGITIEEYTQKQLDNKKRCTKCKLWQDKSLFSKDASRFDELKAQCHLCTRVKEKTCMKGRISPFKGKTHTLETKKRLSEANRGKVSSLKGIPRTEEDKRKITIGILKNAVRGEAHPRWKGGAKNPLISIRRSSQLKEWRHLVFERDKYTCQHCKDSQGGNLNAHHIIQIKDNPDLATVLSNGITLCVDCHRKVHFKSDSIRNKRKAKKWHWA
jgi:NUMOD3 motif/HNH endonuclease